MKKLNYLWASNAVRWMTCTASALLYDSFHEEIKLKEKPNPVALDGIKIHELAARMAEHQFIKTDVIYKDFGKSEYERHIANLAGNKDYLDYAQGFVDYVEQIMPLPLFISNLMIEKKIVDDQLKLSATTDLSFIDHQTRTLHIFDLKTGNVIVYADSYQLLIYAVILLDYYRKDNGEDFIEKVTLHIYQPSKGHIDVKEFTIDEIQVFKNKLIAVLTEIENNAQFKPSPTSCNNCYFKLMCTPFHNYIKTYLEAFMNTENNDVSNSLKLLNNKTISDLLIHKKTIISYLESVEELAKDRLVTGDKIKGIKLVRKITKRKWASDDETVISMLKENGFKNEDITMQKLITLSSFERLVTKKVFNDKYYHLSYKPKGDITIALQDDRRKEIVIDPTDSKEFEQLIKENMGEM